MAVGVASYEEEALALASWALASCEEAAALASACEEACEEEGLASWALASCAEAVGLASCAEEVVFVAACVAAAACVGGQAVHLKKEAGLEEEV